MNGVSGSIRKCKFNDCENRGAEFRSITNKLDLSECEFEGSDGGLVICEGCDLKLRDCRITKSKKVGITVSQSTVTLSGFTISENDGGLSIVSGGKAILDRPVIEGNTQFGLIVMGGDCEVTDGNIADNGVAASLEKGSLDLKSTRILNSKSHGVQVHGQETKLTFVQGTVCGHAHGAGMFIEKGVASVSEVSFEQNKYHLNGRDGARIDFVLCKLTKSLSGIGIQVSSKAVMTMEKSEVYEEEQIGVLIGNEGKLIGNHCTFRECLKGIRNEGKSEMELTECKIYRNKGAGVEVAGGIAKLAKCEVRDQATHGIYIWPGAECEDSLTQFSGNQGKDIHYG
jgi:hypothetical protein